MVASTYRGQGLRRESRKVNSPDLESDPDCYWNLTPNSLPTKHQHRRQCGNGQADGKVNNAGAQPVFHGKHIQYLANRIVRFEIGCFTAYPIMEGLILSIVGIWCGPTLSSLP